MSTPTEYKYEPEASTDLLLASNAVPTITGSCPTVNHLRVPSSSGKDSINQINFDIPTTSMSSVVDPRIMITVPFEIDLTSATALITSGNGESYWFADACAIGQNPLWSICNQLQVTLNNTTVSTQPALYYNAAHLFSDPTSPEYQRAYNAPDQSAEYDDVRDNFKFNTLSQQFGPDGMSSRTWVHSIIHNNTTRVTKVRFYMTCPIPSPLLSASTDAQGLINLNNMTIGISLDTSRADMLFSNDNEVYSASVLGVGGVAGGLADLHCSAFRFFENPHIDYTVRDMAPHMYEAIIDKQTGQMRDILYSLPTLGPVRTSNPVAIAPLLTGSLQVNTSSVSQIPSALYVWSSKHLVSNLGSAVIATGKQSHVSRSNVTRSFGRITRLTVTIGNMAQLGQASPEQLLTISIDNGLEGLNAMLAGLENGGSGAPIRFDVAKDFGIGQAVIGQAGSYSIDITATVQNPSSTHTYDYVLSSMAVFDGYLKVGASTSVQFSGIEGADLDAVKLASIVHKQQERVLIGGRGGDARYGKGFFKNLLSGVRKGFNLIPKAINWIVDKGVPTAVKAADAYKTFRGGEHGGQTFQPATTQIGGAKPKRGRPKLAKL